MVEEIVKVIDNIPSRASTRIAPVSPAFVLPRSFFDFEGIGPRLFIRNVVATFDVGFRPNLEHMAFIHQDKIPGKFNPTGFAAMRLSLFSPGSFRTVALLFANGKVVFTGARSEWHARHEAERFVGFLFSLGYPAQMLDFRIQNIVSSFQFGHPIDCDEVVKKLGSDRVAYDPDDIQACFVRNNATDIENVTTLMFSKGGAVITGIRERAQIERVYREIHALGESVNHDYGADGQSGYRHRQKRALSTPKKLEAINRDITILSEQKKMEASSGRKRTRAEQEQLEQSQLLIEAAEKKKQKMSIRKIKRQARLKRIPAQPFTDYIDTEFEFPNQIQYTTSEIVPMQLSSVTNN